MNRREFFGGAVAASAALAKARADTTKGELPQAQYVIVELMGYKRLCGRLSPGLGGLLQLDVPVEGGFITKFINPTSVYAITIADEKAVKEYAQSVDPIPPLTLAETSGFRGLPYHDPDGNEWDEP